MVIVSLILKKTSRILYMRTKKDIIILPKINYNIKYNISNTPTINTKKNDYDAIRDIVEDKNINNIDKPNEITITKHINKFQIV